MSWSYISWVFRMGNIYLGVDTLPHSLMLTIPLRALKLEQLLGYSDNEESLTNEMSRN